MAEVAAYAGFAALSFLPPVIWLLFYLHEDRHPEPKHLIMFTFVAGILSAVFAVILELGLLGRPIILSDGTRAFNGGLAYRIYPLLLEWRFFILGSVAAIEEYLKYLAVKFAVLSRPDFDEPVDAMIYMVTAALGFAAIENVIFVVPVFERDSLASGFELTANRFLAANLLHALSSAIVGYFLARHVFSPWRKHAVAAGIIIATVLHTAFNYFIIRRDMMPNSLLLVVFLLTIMAVVVFVDFERLKKQTAGKDGEERLPVSGSS